MSCAAASAPPWPVLWAPVFSAVVVGLVSLWAAYIAYRQWVTARTKVQLELYDKRRPVFVAVSNLLGNITPRGAPGPQAMSDFVTAISEARFLFDKPMDDYLDEVTRRCGNLQMDEQTISRLSVGKERQEAADRQVATMAWLSDQYRVLPAKFAPYLQLEGKKTKVAPSTCQTTGVT